MSLTLQNISHHFGDLQVLDTVTFTVSAGEVHALLGENGAGKTTLMHAAYGLFRPDAGEVRVESPSGTQRFPRGFVSPAEARRVGIGMVHQHFTSIAAFTVAENIALAGGWRETGKAAVRRATALIDEVGLPIDPSARTESLSVSIRQRLEILKALAADAKILLLDEPTAVLAPREIGELQRAVRSFAASGGAVVLITHKLDEVFKMADRVTVLRRGRVVLSGMVNEESATSLAKAMLSRGDAEFAEDAEGEREPGTGNRESGGAARGGDILVHATDLTLSLIGSASHRSDAKEAIRNAIFTCRAGEITGVVALEGNGQRELLRAIAGVDDVIREGGTLDVTGPVAFIPDDRLIEALIPSFTLTENVLLGTLGERKWIDWSAARAATSQLLSSYDVRAQSADDQASALSGGNQQKLVFGRAMLNEPRVLVAEQPTRGLDIRATAEIHRRLREAAANGMAVIVSGADLDEIIELADRLLVVANGGVREMSPDASREEIGDAMLGMKR